MNRYILDFSVCVLVCAGLWLRSRAKYRSRNPERHPLPPGPKGLPIIGNVFDMPHSYEWLTVTEWGKKYGDMVYVENFGQPLVFVNSYDIAVDLMEKRSSIYSDRPILPMLSELMGWSWLLSIVPYGDTFRKQRWIYHKFFQRTAVENYTAIQTRETYRFIENLIDSPTKHNHHIRRLAGAIIMMVAYGYEVAPEGDKYITMADAALKTLSHAQVPGKYLVESFHSMKHIPDWFPGAEFKRKAKEWYKLSRAMVETPYYMTKNKILEGSAIPSIMSRLVEGNLDKDGQVKDEEIIMDATAGAYAAGSDTTVSSISSFLLALVLCPEVQRRGQEEVDRVVGKERLPTFEDRDSMPYVEGIVREVLRWNPVVPLGVPHSLMKDDVYNGFFIPAGTLLFANQWLMLHDKKMYPNPFSFQPERWLQKEGQIAPRNPSQVSFGFGRRICPGRHFADNSIFISVATILATLNVKKALDANGQPITPKGDYEPGFLSHPAPFDCSITPRSPEIVALLRQAIDLRR